MIAYKWGWTPASHAKFVALRIKVQNFEVTPKQGKKFLMRFQKLNLALGQLSGQDPNPDSLSPRQTAVFHARKP